MNDILEFIEKSAGFATSTIALVAFISMLITPVRNKLIEWINKQVGTGKQNEQIEELRKMIVDNNAKINEKIDGIIEDNKKQNEKIELLQQGEIASIGSRIIDTYYKYKGLDNVDGFIIKNISHDYQIYKKMGGNSFVDDAYNHLKEKGFK